MSDELLASPALAPSVVAALSQTDDEGAIAEALLAELVTRLDLSGAVVLERSDGRAAVVAHAGRPLLDPPIFDSPRVVTVAGGFGRAIATSPAWTIFCERATPPNAAERAVLTVAADAAGIALAHARRERRRRSEARNGRALAELGQTLALASGEDQVLHLLTLAVARLLPQEGVSAWRTLPDSLELVASAGYRPRVAPHPGARVPITEEVSAIGRSRRVQQVAAGSSNGLVRGDVASIVPIGERGANRAVLVVEGAIGEGSAEERLLLGIADQALLTLENERLIEAERGTLDAVVACLGRALAVRHERTAEHSDRLTVDCVAVARRLGMSGERLRDVSFAAALHDLGKIGIPARVLDNKGALSPEDWQLIHTHPELGARIIDPVPALAGTAALIRACHEHYDGSGYPRGLRGDEIPPGAMIVFTCDAYHAMREDRPYQAALSEQEARRRLDELSGVRFDPRVVEALLAHLGRGDAGETNVHAG